MKEEWRPVVGYEMAYEVSNSGKVRRIGSSANRRPCINNSGYMAVSLSIKGRLKTHPIHRLVATSFIGPRPDRKKVINHINGQKLDNRLINLEYTTQSRNMLLAYASGSNHICGSSHPKSVLSEADVLKIREMCTTKAKGYANAARIFHVNIVTVRHIVTRKIWKHLPAIRAVAEKGRGRG